MESDNIIKERALRNFKIYFDGVGEVISPEPDVPNTFQMGLCKLDFNIEKNAMEVHLRRPGMLIGKAGRTLEKAQKDLGYKFLIFEVNVFKV